MNTSQLKTYAPEARKVFIAAVSAQAARLGITAKGSAPAEVQGDVLLVSGQAFPRAIASARKMLVDRVQANGFAPTMEAIAYTWFNRFVAIRYMELHGYFDHGYRVLSHPEGHPRPEILDHAADVDLPGLDRARAVELKLDGTQDEELYRLLLKAQCNALHQAMPFLFERIGDETELLLPANLLHTDSLIRQLVEGIDESAWNEIEIIGWLYQFYISEKKDQVIGKVVKSEDIPAATQLFTPNWIVKYMVQNSLGAQWLATYPHSPLKGQMAYYIEPAEQTEEVKAQLKAITPSTLNPEELTLIDPACGSGHILVEAYELFKAIYLERGYRQRDIAKLILEKNLFGLDIDERAAQLTGFALMMKGRADDRRLFERGVKLNVMALVNSGAVVSGQWLVDSGVAGSEKLASGVDELVRCFEHATTFGSLIQVPEELAPKLLAVRQLSETISQDLFVADALKRLGPLVRQAEMLAAKYDAVVANPPYMGGGGMNAQVKEFAKDNFPDAKSDLFACFIERSYTLAKGTGRVAMVTMQNWMFLSSFEKMRERMLREKTIASMAQIGYNSFPSMNSKVAQATVFSLVNHRDGNFVGTFIDLNSAPQSADKEAVFLARDSSNCFAVAADEFKKIPGSPVAYWVSRALLDIFVSGISVGDFADVKRGMTTSDNARFLRFWPEVSFLSSCRNAANEQDAVDSKAKWFPYSKGGGYRKWYGFLEYFVNWEESGRDIIAFAKTINSSYTRTIVNIQYYFRPSVGFPYITSGLFSMRSIPVGCIYDSGGPGIFASEEKRNFILGCMNSSPAGVVLKALNPTLNLQIADVVRLPLPKYEDIKDDAFLLEGIPRLVAIARQDWDLFETSWDFQSIPILPISSDTTPTLEASYIAWATKNHKTIAEMKGLEEKNNRLFINAYNLQDEFTPDVSLEQITLTVNPAYRYGGKLTEEEQWTRFRQDTMQELVSYAIGCMMGRYSLDEPGLIYAHSGNVGFDASRYATFPADEDGIVPITDTEWFDDDAVHRLISFISVAWDAAHLEDNLTFLADNLSPKKTESSRETIRRYLCDSFFKDHLQTYKKRPIYWLFSSGKQKAFQCLVYLHRYNEGTLSRIRSEYVIPLQGKMAARLEQLQGDIQVATSTAHQKGLEKERARLEKQQVELLDFDEKLRHYADMRIALDLDDGVKVNYGKFGDLLAEVKAVTGGKGDV